MRRIKSPTAVAALLALAVSCSPATSSRPEVEPVGPPEVDLRAVARHARQFDHELAGRTAGSQQEEIAAGYILGHLQQAGYVARLDGVPVADLVRSTNVIAVAPSGEDASVLVAVAYDSSKDRPSEGDAVGLFLEVARALRVLDDDHSVEFVALGAEHATVGGGHLGIRRLAQLLEEDGRDPFVVLIGDMAEAAPFSAKGPGAGLFSLVSKPTNPPRKSLPPDAGSLAALAVLEDAGLNAAVVGGDTRDVGRALLGFLLQQGS